MKKPIRKALGAVFLAVAIAITQVPVSNVNAASDYQMNGNTLTKYTGTASVVSVPATVKEIGPEAFTNCANITSLNLPASVEKIGSGAFRGCSSLQTLVIGNGVTDIDSQAFADCKSLVSVSIPKTVKMLGSGVFAGDKNLATVSIAADNPYYVCSDGVIYKKDLSKVVEMLPKRAAENYIMPNTVTDIEKYAFWGCKNLKDIVLSPNLSEIPGFAFSYCKGLETVTIPYSVYSIDAKAFEYCRSLTDVVIPPSVRSIHPSAFDGCSKLNIIAEAGSPAQRFFETFDASNAAFADYDENEDLLDEETYEIDLNKKTVSGNTSDVSDVSSVDMDEYVMNQVDGPEVIGRTRVVYHQAVVFVDNSKVDVLEGNESITDSNSQDTEDKAELTPEELYNYKYTIVNGDTVADKAYYGNTDLEDYVFPTGIKNIGDFSFARSGLKSIQIPKGVTHIGYGAFYHCDQLENIIIPNSVQTIEPSAFEHTPWLTNWKNGGDVDDFLVVGDGILVGYKGYHPTLTIPSNVKKIGANVFKDHNELKALYLPDSLIEIGEDAFNGCVSLTQISGGNNLQKIADRAFYGVPVASARITPAVSLIGTNAFGGNDSTASVVFNGLTLPNLSYEKTATRLANDDYRTNAFGTIKVAVVNAAVNKFENTILDENSLGFRGIVVSVTADPTDTTYGTVKLKYCTLEPDETTGVVTVPEAVSIYGQEYKLNEVDENAFKAYKDCKWTNNRLTEIQLNPALSSMVSFDSLAYSEEPGAYVNSLSQNSMFISVEDENQTLKYIDTFTGEFEHREDLLRLHVKSDTTSLEELKNAVEATYGTISNGQLFTMDLSLYNQTNQVPISKLGKEPMTITMSIPPGMEDDTLCVVTLDSNGQLETNYVTYVSKGEKNCISFDITHFSPYGIYAATGELKDKLDEKISNPSGKAGKDKSPDTGDYLDPRWFLAGGFICFGLILLLKKDKKIIIE